MTAVLLLALTAVALAAVLLLLTKLDRSGPAGIAARIRFGIQRFRVARRHGFVLAGLEPEAGALTLAMAANLSQNDLQRGVLETFVMESSVLDRLPLMPIDGNAYAYNAELALPGVEFRAVNAAYTESTGTFTPLTETLVILGGDADVDTFIAKTRSNINDQRAAQEALKVKAAVYKFQDAFINGDTAVDANSFDGLKKRITGAQVIDAGTDGLGVVTGANDFFDKLDELIAAVPGGPDALYMNSGIRSKIMSSGRRLGGVEWVSRLFLDDERITKRIPTYNGIEMLDIGNKGDGTAIIPQTETQGLSNVASSIYAVKFGEDEGDQAVTGLTSSANGDGVFDVRDLGEIDSKPVFRTRIEGFLGLAVFGRGAARLRGVLNT